MKRQLFAVLLCTGLTSLQVNAEIITNSKGEKIELKANGTWVKVKVQSATKNIVNDKDVLMLNIKDGNNNNLKIRTFIKNESSNQKPVYESEIQSLVNITAYKAKIALKNEYSFMPKGAMVTLKDGIIQVFVKYTGKNSYGAEVVDSELVPYVLKPDGTYGFPDE